MTLDVSQSLGLQVLTLFPLVPGTGMCQVFISHSVFPYSILVTDSTMRYIWPKIKDTDVTLLSQMITHFAM